MFSKTKLCFSIVIVEPLALCVCAGCAELPEEPVCAVKMVWGSDRSIHNGIACHPKVGVDGNELHWKSLKPFDDINLFITGDVFTAWDRTGAYQSFSETSLLTSERILFNYFGLQPLIDGLCLTNPWPKKLVSKL